MNSEILSLSQQIDLRAVVPISDALHTAGLMTLFTGL